MNKIIVVEDEQMVAADICEELRSLGYEVPNAIPSGEEAIAKVKELKPDLIFMDITLQGRMDGIETISVIHRTQDIPVVFLTAHAEEQILQRAKLAKPYGYILKPFEKEELRITTELALSRRQAEKLPPATEEEETAFSIIGDPKTSEGREEMFASHPLLRKLSHENVVTLAGGSVLKGLAAGESLIMEGDDIRGGFIVVSGRLAVVKSTESGKELTVELLSPGDATGILMALENRAPAYLVRAQVDSRVLWISVPCLRSVLRAQPDLYEALLSASAERAQRFGNLALSLAHAKVEERIIATLLALAPRFGKSTVNNDQVRIFLTRKELADLTGTTSETAIRVTKALERTGLLDLTRPGIIKIPSLKDLQAAEV
jgi:CRP-like cAMP-binding protein/DNA-binding NarL/FixJ family response regulator